MGIAKIHEDLEQKKNQIENLNAIMSNDNDLPSIGKDEITNQLEALIKEKEELETIINAYNIVKENMQILKDLPKTQENREKYNACAEEIRRNKQFLSEDLKKEIIDNLNKKDEIVVEEVPDEEEIEEPIQNTENVETLENTVLINKIKNISESLWIEVDTVRNKLNKSTEEKKDTPKAKSKGRKLNKSAYVSISAMAIVTSFVSVCILIFGIMILN